jgi:hypothetical protein
MIDYTAILTRKYKDSEWTLNGEDYSGLTWLSDSKKPTKNQLDALWVSVLEEIESEKTTQFADEQAKSEAQARAVAKLQALGLTAEEIAALKG